MSFTDPQLSARIQNLHKQFEEIDSEDELPSIVGLDDFSIRLAVISNLFKTLQASLDQISVCFEVSKSMFFYQDLIVQNPEFWGEEQGVNRQLCSNNFKMAKMDMEEAGRRLDLEVMFLQAQQGANQSHVHRVLGLVTDYQALVGRFHEAAGFLTEAQGRAGQNLPRYDADQKPELGADDPEAHLKAIHMKSSKNADAALVDNADLADSLFASVHFMRACDLPQAEIQLAVDFLALVLNRFEILEDVRDNRYGFTQIRFG